MNSVVLAGNVGLGSRLHAPPPLRPMATARQSFLRAFLAAAALVTTGRATADDGARMVSWSLHVSEPAAAEGCTDERALAMAVEHQLGRSTLRASGPVNVAIEVRLDRTRRAPTEWRAVIRGVRADGSSVGPRELRSLDPACASLDESMVLVIALLIDPAAALGAPAVAPAPAPVPVPAAPAAVPNPAAPAPAPIPDHPPLSSTGPTWRGALRAEASGAIGLLPSVAPGGTLAAVVEPPHVWPLEARVSGWATQTATAAPGGGSFSLLSGALSVCPTLEPAARLRLSVCAGAELGSIRAEGFGFDHTYARSQTLWALTGGLRLAVPIAGPLFVSVGARLLVPLVRPRFTYADAGDVAQDIYRTPAAGGAADLGAGWRF